MAATKSTASKKSAASRSSAPARPRRGVQADTPADPPLVVGLQASFSINETLITLNTQDISKLKGGIQFQLAQPAVLGSLADFLKWAATEIPDFPKVDPSTWPEPFNGLANMVVTIDEFCINNTVDPAVYTLAVTIVATDPKPKIPIIPVTIEGFGVRIAKGDCKASIGSGA